LAPAAGGALGVGASVVLVGAIAVLLVTRSAAREPVAVGFEREDG
jgi:hypothetical protein